MIPVSVGKDEMVFVLVFLNQKIAESPDSCAGINYNYIIAFCPNFQTGCIATIFKIFFS